MLSFTLPALTATAAALLARAGLDHARAPSALRGALQRQELLPPVTRGPLSRLLGPVELGLGLALALALGTGVAAIPVGGSTFLAGSAFLAFLVVLARTRPAAPCGCRGDDQGVTTTDLLPAALVALGGLAATCGAPERLQALTAAERATTLVAGVALALSADAVARAIRPVAPPVPS